MSRVKKNMDADEVEEAVDPDKSKSILSSILSAKDDEHDNYYEVEPYLVSTGSIKLDQAMGGGIGPGIHRFTGYAEGGKTSEALTLCSNFLATRPKGKGLYVKAEGKLSETIMKRSGLKFVTDPDKWEVGTIFILKSNVYSCVASIVRDLLNDSESGNEYFFILDSMDGLRNKDEVDKPYTDNQKVAAGAAMTSRFLGDIGGRPENRGHIMILISQVRATVDISQYAANPKNMTTATGGRALEHYPTWILEFDKRKNGEDLLEHPEIKPDIYNNKILGHIARIALKKTPNEKTGMVVTYPIKHDRPGGKSVWTEYEIVDLMMAFKKVTLKGSWISFEENIAAQLKEAGFEIPEKVQGKNKLFALLESDDKLTEFLAQQLKGLLV